MNTMKKLFALMLALMMVLSLAVPAMAAEGEGGEDGSEITPPQNTEPNYSITLTDKYEGHTYQAYQIFAGDYKDGILANIRWGAGFKAENAVAFLNKLQEGNAFNDAFDGIKADSDIPAEIAKVLSVNTDFVKEFAKVVHLNEGGVYSFLSGTYYSSTCNQNGENYVYTFGSAENEILPGYYLIKDADGSLEADDYDFYSRLMVQVVGEVSIQPKGDVPKVDKKVHLSVGGTFQEYENASMADVVYFKLTGTLPSNLADYENYSYEFVDHLPVGLNLDQTTVGDGLDEFGGIVEICVDHHGTDDDVYFDLTIDPEEASNDPDSDKRFNLLLANSEAEVIEGQTDIVITYNKNTRELRIKFVDLRTSLPKLVTTDSIVIKYAAKLNPDALNLDGDKLVLGNGSDGNGNKNVVYVNFSNNPQGDGTGRTPEADAKVYTYQLNVQKVGENASPLADAEFVLYQRISGSGNTTSYKYAIFDETAENGSYVIKNWITLPTPIGGESKDLDDYKEGDPNVALDANKTPILIDGKPVTLDNMIVVSPESGLIEIIGLEAVDHWLAELNAPLPYNVKKEPISVSIKSTHDENSGTITELTVSADGTLGVADKSTGVGTITVQNNKGNTLPSTGGIGTTIFYVAGGLLVVAAITLLITKKRMSEK